MELADNLTDAHPPGLPFPNRMHRFVTLDRAVGSPERPEALARSQIVGGLCRVARALRRVRLARRSRTLRYVLAEARLTGTYSLNPAVK